MLYFTQEEEEWIYEVLIMNDWELLGLLYYSEYGPHEKGNKITFVMNWRYMTKIELNWIVRYINYLQHSYQIVHILHM